MVFELIFHTDPMPEADLRFSPEVSLKFHGNRSLEGFFYQDQEHIGFFSDKAVVRSPSGTYEELTKAEKLVAPGFLSNLENEVSGIIVSKQPGAFCFTAFSCKASRSRIYFLKKQNSLYFSLDLRELLSYSGRILNQKVAYGIIKYGETPEFETVIEDIFAIPVSSYLKIDQENVLDIFGAKPPSFTLYFQFYYRISFPQTGGDLNRTEQELGNILQFLSQRGKTGMLVSGGIDSTLLNFIFSQQAEQNYPAFFLNFPGAPTEYSYVKKSMAGTKAELIPVDITAHHFNEVFVQSVQRLLYPVYDNGSAYSGQFFYNFLSERGMRDFNLVDGTAADSCYGVRDYNIPLMQGKKQAPAVSYLKQWVYAQGLLRKEELFRKRFFPRDAFGNDEFLQDLQWYAGPFANLWFPEAKKFTAALETDYQYYYSDLNDQYREDYWARYTTLKMYLYAAKQTNVKSYDMLLPVRAQYPFLYKSVLEDQGKYSWKEKAKEGIVKYPLKKILEKYVEPDFIYRKKMGMQSRTLQWMQEKAHKPFFVELLDKPEGIVDLMMGKSNKKTFIKAFKSRKAPIDVVKLGLSLSVMQCWMDVHQIKSGKR